MSTQENLNQNDLPVATATASPSASQLANRSDQGQGGEEEKPKLPLDKLPNPVLARIVELLPHHDLKSLSRINDGLRFMCAPHLFRAVLIREGGDPCEEGTSELAKFMHFMDNRGAADFRSFVK